MISKDLEKAYQVTRLLRKPLFILGFEGILILSFLWALSTLSLASVWSTLLFLGTLLLLGVVTFKWAVLTMDIARDFMIWRKFRVRLERYVQTKGLKVVYEK